MILHKSDRQIQIWKEEINKFLRERLFIKLHPNKSKIIHIKRGIDFVGFRNFYHYRLLRKRNIRNMQKKIENYKEGDLCFGDIYESYKGWQAHAFWADTYELRRKIIGVIWDKIEFG